MPLSYLGLKKTDLDTPCLVIDINDLTYNLKTMQQHALKNNIHVRPHCKTHKCSRLAKLQIEYGAIGISAAKVSEAEILVNQGLSSILITSPVVTPQKIARLIACIKKSPDLLLVVDNIENIIDLNQAGQAIQQRMNILIDVDPGLGRTGISPKYALDLGFIIHKLEWLNLVGIQCYAGNLQHIHAFDERRQASLDVMEYASELVKLFKHNELPCSILTGTGTGTYDIDIEAAEITEIQPGSYTVMDVEYAEIESKNTNPTFTTFKQSMTLLTTVISSNHPDHVTVDAGTKAIYFDPTHKPKIISHPGLQYDWGGFGDEHGKITAINHAPLPKNKDVLELIVPHCDPTINLFDQFFITDQGVVIDVWDIDLRGKSQ